MVAIDVVDGRERVSRVHVVLPEPQRDRERRHGAKQDRVAQPAPPRVNEGAAQRQIEPTVVADEACASEEQGSDDGTTGPEQKEACEKQRAKGRLAGRGGARLDV